VTPAALLALLLAAALPVSAPAAGEAAPQHQHQHPAPQPSPQSPASPPAPPATPPEGHEGHGGQPPGQAGGHDHAAHGHGAGAEEGALPAFIPPLTDADRAAAFPEVQGHAVHDRAINYFVLFDQLEWTSKGDGGFTWDNKGWVGRDRDRLWFRTEGEAADGRLEEGQAHILYGRQIARWWDVVGGIRQDVRPGPAQTWAAIGVQGLAPYWFEIEATAYFGASGRTHLRFESEYELLLTNRLILQPLVELEVYGKDDPEHRIGAGLSSMETGLRLRYEFRRELAPYVGVSWNRKFFGTGDYAVAAGERRSGTALVLGLRFWL
jgi:copper resistance protein B